jgi:hypothetical protein
VKVEWVRVRIWRSRWPSVGRWLAARGSERTLLCCVFVCVPRAGRLVSFGSAGGNAPRALESSASQSPEMGERRTTREGEATGGEN